MVFLHWPWPTQRLTQTLIQWLKYPSVSFCVVWTFLKNYHCGWTHKKSLSHVILIPRPHDGLQKLYCIGPQMIQHTDAAVAAWVYVPVICSIPSGSETELSHWSIYFIQEIYNFKQFTFNHFCTEHSQNIIYLTLQYLSTTAEWHCDLFRVTEHHSC